jgi:hypothetical protein
MPTLGMRWLRPRWRVIMQVEAADEVPSELPEYGVVVVGGEQYPRWLVFDCPCGKGHRIMLNLDPSRRPVWRVWREPLTISPSIDDVTKTRRCHFFLRRGRVYWVRGLEGSWY